MRWDHHIFMGILFGSILGVFYAAELSKYLPLMILAGVVYLLGYFVRAEK